MAATTTLAQALLAFQAEHIEIPKLLKNDHLKYKYAGLDSVMSTVIPAANKCGLVVMQLPTVVDAVPSLTTRIIHAQSGESVESTMPLAITKPDPQTFGAALTYARRYGLMSMLGLVADEDTDGFSPSTRSAPGKAEPAKRKATEEAPNGSSPPAAGTTAYATEAQRKRLFALAKEHGVDGPTLRAILGKETGQESTAQIPRDKYDAVCVAVQTYQLAASLATDDGLPFE